MAAIYNAYGMNCTYTDFTYNTSPTNGGAVMNHSAAGQATTQQTKAQILYMDNEEEIGGSRTGSGIGNIEFPNVPNLDVTYDQLAPLGEGLFVLAALSGAYLIGRRRKENE